MRRTAGLKVRCSGAAVALWLHVVLPAPCCCWLGVDARIMYMSKEVVFGMQISSGPSLRAVIVATDSTIATHAGVL